MSGKDRHYSSKDVEGDCLCLLATDDSSGIGMSRRLCSRYFRSDHLVVHKAIMMMIMMDDDSWCTFKATMVKKGLPIMNQSYSKP